MLVIKVLLNYRECSQNIYTNSYRYYGNINRRIDAYNIRYTCNDFFTTKIKIIAISY